MTRQEIMDDVAARYNAIPGRAHHVIIVRPQRRYKWNGHSVYNFRRTSCKGAFPKHCVAWAGN